MHVRVALWLGLALTGATAAHAQGDARATLPAGGAGAPAAAQPAAGGGGITTTFAWRSRAESWRWFGAATEPVADGRYDYLGTIVRGGIGGRRPGLAWTLEGAVPILLGLPDDAIAGAPRGQLGLGATYFAANDRSRNVVRAFVKQAYVRLGAAAGAGGHAVRLGRFEFAEGAELAPADPTIATLKSSRIAQRLVGPFGWTHVGRAFDGVHYTHDRRARPNGPGAANVTLAAFAPTPGAFEADGWRTLPIYVGYGAYTRGVRWGAGPRAAQSDLRVFALHYDDQRDPRRFTPGLPGASLPATQRPTGDQRVRVTTYGGHVVHVVPTAAGPVDLLAWGALQTGRWGALDHAANANALEAGWQPAGVPGRPWVRAMWFHGSGDANAADGEHGTFFEVLPTPRPFARFPIHNLMNLE